jgi:hypothetical protein
VTGIERKLPGSLCSMLKGIIRLRMTIPIPLPSSSASPAPRQNLPQLAESQPVTGCAPREMPTRLVRAAALYGNDSVCCAADGRLRNSMLDSRASDPPWASRCELSWQTQSDLTVFSGESARLRNIAAQHFILSWSRSARAMRGLILQLCAGVLMPRSFLLRQQRYREAATRRSRRS